MGLSWNMNVVINSPVALQEFIFKGNYILGIVRIL